MGNYPPRKIKGQKGEQFTFERHPFHGMADTLWRANERLDVSQGTHGTTMFEQPSRHILPASAHGNSVFPGLSDSSRAYFTAQRKPEQVLEGDDARQQAEISGWHWAGTAQQTQTREGVRPRRVVHEVTPEGKVDLDKNLNDEGYGVEMTADRLRITKTHWAPPPEMFPGKDVVGVQSTIPHVNWNQFAPADGADRNFDVIRRHVLPPRQSPGTSDEPKPPEDPRQGKLAL